MSRSPSARTRSSDPRRPRAVQSDSARPLQLATAAVCCAAAGESGLPPQRGSAAQIWLPPQRGSAAGMSALACSAPALRIMRGWQRAACMGPDVRPGCARSARSQQRKSMFAAVKCGETSHQWEHAQGARCGWGRNALACGHCCGDSSPMGYCKVYTTQIADVLQPVAEAIRLLGACWEHSAIAHWLGKHPLLQSHTPRVIVNTVAVCMHTLYATDSIQVRAAHTRQQAARP